MTITMVLIFDFDEEHKIIIDDFKLLALTKIIACPKLAEGV